MTRKDWFIVQNSIIDRDDLNLYEKMCCVVLARYADKEEFDDLLTSDIIAIKMGVDSIVAKKAVFTLIEKGLINFEGKSKIELEEEIYEEELKIESILNESNNDKILKSEESTNKISMEEFKKRLTMVNSIKNDDFDEYLPKANKNIVRNDDSQKEFTFADLKFEDMFSEDIPKEVPKEMLKEKSKEEFEEEKIEINLKNKSDLQSDLVDNVTHKSNDKSMYSNLSEEAKYHLGMLEKEPIKTQKPQVNSVVKSGGSYKKVAIKGKDEYHNLVDQVYAVIDEPINEREARIILSFADNDINRIKEKYKIAKLSQINDKIEVLINELQKKEKQFVDVSNASVEEIEKLPQTQINLANINKMKMYSKYSKK